MTTAHSNLVEIGKMVIHTTDVVFVRIGVGNAFQQFPLRVTFRRTLKSRLREISSTLISTPDTSWMYSRTSKTRP